MSCRVIKVGGVTSVFNTDGSPSSLYAEALEAYEGNEAKAVGVWNIANTEEFEEVVGKTSQEATLDDVLAFTSAVIEDSLPSFEGREIADIIEFMENGGFTTLSELRDKLTDLFYKEGVFEIDTKKLVKSGLYSVEEAESLNPKDIAQTIARINKQIEVGGDISVEAKISGIKNTSRPKNILGSHPFVTEAEVVDFILNNGKEALVGSPYEFVQNNIDDKTTPKSKIAPKKKQKVTVRDVIDRLSLTGLANKVNILSPKQIDEKLKELGVDVKVYKQIIGRKGARELDDYSIGIISRLDDLAIAERMEREGKTPIEIKLATGWERGGEFISIFENRTDDEVVTYLISLGINEPNLQEIKDNEQTFQRQNGIYNGKWRYEIGDGSLKNIAEFTFTRSSEGLKAEVYTVKLGSILLNDELYRTYPGLIDTLVTFFKPSEESNYREMLGFELNGNIYINYDKGFGLHTRDRSRTELGGNKHIHSVLSHEIQHIIQNKEGFEGGSSLGVSKPRVLGVIEKVERNDRLTEEEKEIKKIIDSLYPNKTLTNEEVDKVALRVYGRSVGEVEARNVERRIGNKEGLLRSTEDIIREKQLNIIQFQQPLLSITPNGFVYDGEVFFNEEKINDFGLLVHEFNHLYTGLLKQTNRPLYERGLQLVEQEGQEYINHVRRTQPNLEGEALLEEALTQAVGEQGARIVDQARKNKFVQFLADVWNAIKGQLGLSAYSNSQVQKMNLKEYVNAMAVDLLSGERLGQSNIQNNFSNDTAKNEIPLSERNGFNENVKFIQQNALEYKQNNKINSVETPPLLELNTDFSREMANVYESIESTSSDEKVINSYNAMVKEVIDQYDFIVSKGLKVKRNIGEGEPYKNSSEMLKDLRENNSLTFLPNDVAFGSEGQNSEGRIGLQSSGRFLEDGYEMTVSEVFRVVHDYFGHGILGNQFGALGEENATLQHLDLFSDEAKPAVIFQTRGQNSWVNFSGVNQRSKELQRQAREERKKGNNKKADELFAESEKMFTFAEPKDNVFPNIYNFKKYETVRRIQEKREIEKSENYLDPRGEQENNDFSKLLSEHVKTSRSTRGVDRRDVQGIRNIRIYDVNVVAEYTLDGQIENGIKKAFPKYKGNQKIYEITDGDVFRQMMINSLENNPFKSSVTVHSAEEFSNMRMFITEDGSTGITLTKDGFLGGAWSDPTFKRPNNVSQLLILGIKEGALTAEAFDTVLPDMYSMYGLKAVSRTEFNEEYRPLVENGALEDWNYDTYAKFNNGKPDVVFFIYDGGSRDSIEDRIGQFDSYNSYQKAETAPFDKDSYDSAYRYMEIEAINRGNYERSERIKSATSNVGTFSSKANDIQYSFLNDSDFDSTGQVKPSVLEEIEAERNAIREQAIKDGSFMKAPNGKPTNLNEDQWIDVRSKRFKSWFGDWQNSVPFETENFAYSSSNEHPYNKGFLYEGDLVIIDSEEYKVSEETEYDGVYKVERPNKEVKYISVKDTNNQFQLDANGEPKIFFHNTDTDFESYDLEYSHKNNKQGGSVAKGIYLTRNKKRADDFGGKITKPFFVKSSNPFNGIDSFSKDSIDRAIELVSIEIDNSDHPNKEHKKKEAEFDIKDKMTEGVIPYISGYFTPSIITQVLMFEGFDGVIDGASDFVVFSPNQIKSATSNVGTFSSETNDIRFQQPYTFEETKLDVNNEGKSSVGLGDSVINEAESYSQLPVLSVGVGGTLTTEDLTAFSEAKNLMIVGNNLKKFFLNKNLISELTVEVYNSQEKEVKSVLRQIENEMIKNNIDVIGIEQLYNNRTALTSLLDSLEQMMTSPTEENIKIFSDVKTEYLPTENINKVFRNDIPTQYKNLTIVNVESNLSNDELFEQEGLVKVMEGNLYHKVQREGVDVMYEKVYEKLLRGEMSIPSKFLPDGVDIKDPMMVDVVMLGLRNFINSREVGFPTTNKEEVSLIQVAYGHSPMIKKNINTNITTDTSYLTSKFVSDFYNYVLKEKQKNSDIYNNTLKFFRFNDADISYHGINPIDFNSIEYSAELQDYGRIKKDGSGIINEVVVVKNEDVEVVNNPSIIKNTPSIIENNGVYYTKTSFDTYIRVGDKVARKVMDFQSHSIYAPIKTNTSNIYNDVDLNFSIPTTSIVKDYLKWAENNNLNQKTDVEAVQDKVKNLTQTSVEGIQSVKDFGITINNLTRKDKKEYDECSL